MWCGWRDSNSHTLRRQNLNLVRLPISPHPRFCEVADYTALQQNCKRFLARRAASMVRLKTLVGLQIAPFALRQRAQFNAPDADAF